jgi:hypothetical protein
VQGKNPGEEEQMRKLIHDHHDLSHKLTTEVNGIASELMAVKV